LSKSAFTRQYARFRSLLVEARTEAGLSQAQLAAKLGRPQSFVSKYERGDRRLDVVEFLDVSRALNLDATRVLLAVDSEFDASGRRSRR
jgi:transcriptional regulator with XRE-family HTH domain